MKKFSNSQSLRRSQDLLRKHVETINCEGITDQIPKMHSYYIYPRNKYLNTMNPGDVARRRTLKNVHSLNLHPLTHNSDTFTWMKNSREDEKINQSTTQT